MRARHLLAAGGLMVSCMAAIMILSGMHPWEETEESQGFGLFSWREEVMADTEEGALAECIHSAFVTEIYQYFSEGSFQSGAAASFTQSMARKGIGVYALVGEASWAYEEDGSSLKEAVRQVAEFNRQQGKEGQVQGVMVDVEPYLLEEWDGGREAREALMGSFLKGMENAYGYAAGQQLKFLVCIPTFYDATNEPVLEELIAYACDGVAVMNYNRTDEYGQMAKEVGYAREFGKEIICIYELQKAGRHQLEEINTYAEEGMEALWHSAQRLEKQFGYGGLRFAYHYYEPLKELLGKGLQK